MSGYQFSTPSEARLRTVNPVLQRIARRALQISKVDFGVPRLGGKRTAEEQHGLWLSGDSQLDGYEKLSYHQTGNAVDLFAYVDGEVVWEGEPMAVVAAAMLQAASELGYKLTWGGLWRDFVDCPHFQLEE